MRQHRENCTIYFPFFTKNHAKVSIVTWGNVFLKTWKPLKDAPEQAGNINLIQNIHIIEHFPFYYDIQNRDFRWKMESNGRRASKKQFFEKYCIWESARNSSESRSRLPAIKFWNAPQQCKFENRVFGLFWGSLFSGTLIKISLFSNYA